MTQINPILSVVPISFNLAPSFLTDLYSWMRGIPNVIPPQFQTQYNITVGKAVGIGDITINISIVLGTVPPPASGECVIDGEAMPFTYDGVTFSVTRNGDMQTTPSTHSVGAQIYILTYSSLSALVLFFAMSRLEQIPEQLGASSVLLGSQIQAVEVANAALQNATQNIGTTQK